MELDVGTIVEMLDLLYKLHSLKRWKTNVDDGDYERFRHTAVLYSLRTFITLPMSGRRPLADERHVRDWSYIPGPLGGCLLVISLIGQPYHFAVCSNTSLIIVEAFSVTTWETETLYTWF